MEKITVGFKREGSGALKLTASAACAGARYDNLSRQLEFIRPEEREGDSLILYFSDNYNAFKPVNLGIGNYFVIGGRLTKRPELRLQVAFEKGGKGGKGGKGREIERSDIIVFKLMESLQKGSEPVFGTADTDSGAVPEVSGVAFSSAKFEDNALMFQNMFGENVCKISFEAGLNGDPGEKGDPGDSRMTCVLYQ